MFRKPRNSQPELALSLADSILNVVRYCNVLGCATAERPLAERDSYTDQEGKQVVVQVSPSNATHIDFLGFVTAVLDQS